MKYLNIFLNFVIWKIIYHQFISFFMLKNAFQLELKNKIQNKEKNNQINSFFKNESDSLGFYCDSIVPFWVSRGFYYAEVIEKGDKILNLGCGDGFYTKRFFAPKATKVDALECDYELINYAINFNDDAKIKYYKTDFLSSAFPDNNYDIVISNNSNSKLLKKNTDLVLNKIVENINPEGIFIGSDLISYHTNKGYIIFNNDPDKIKNKFLKYFKYVFVRIINSQSREGLEKKEIFWRCSNNLLKILQFNWG